MAVTFKKKSATPTPCPVPGKVKDQVMGVIYALDKVDKIAGVKLYRNLMNSSLVEAKNVVEGWMDEYAFAAAPAKGTITINSIVFDHGNALSSNLSSECVDLKTATKLHQPVYGTGSGSIYHVVALSKVVNIAVRIQKDYSVAVRAAIRVPPTSTTGKATKYALEHSAGMDKKSQGHYSLHLKPDNFVMATRCVGSILFSTGLQFDQISTHLELLKGAGE